MIAVIFIVIAATFSTYGITYDEPLQQRYGEAILDYYGGLFGGERDTTALEYWNIYYYGGLFDTLVAAVARLLPLPTYEVRHFSNALCGLLVLLAAMRLGQHLGGPMAGFWAVALLALTPRFWGHMFNNPKDIPFAVGYAWAVYFLVRGLPHLPRLPRGLALKTALAIGVAMGVRVGGLILLVYLGAMIVIAAGVQLARSRERLGSLLLDGLASFSWVALPAYGLMLTFWPWAQQAPLRRPFEALRVFGDFAWNGTVLFDGARLPAAELPRTYLVHYLVITLPEIVLVLLAPSNRAARTDRTGYGSVVPTRLQSPTSPISSALLASSHELTWRSPWPETSVSSESLVRSSWRSSASEYHWRSSSIADPGAGITPGGRPAPPTRTPRRAHVPPRSHSSATDQRLTQNPGLVILRKRALRGSKTVRNRAVTGVRTNASSDTGSSSLAASSKS